jgi:hypothetical protein
VENASHVRIIVVDRATGNVGSLQIPLKVAAAKNPAR